jgi:hypothetical protein
MKSRLVLPASLSIVCSRHNLPSSSAVHGSTNAAEGRMPVAAMRSYLLHPWGRLLLLLLLAIPLPSLSEVYRCTNGEGHITYSEEPCPGQHSDALNIDTAYPPPKYAAPSGLRPGELRFLREIEQREKLRKKRIENSRRVSAAAAKADERREEKCLRYKEKIKDLRREMRSGYTARRGNYLNEKMVEYKGEIKTWCR